jgi:hypothetical protein
VTDPTAPGVGQARRLSAPGPPKNRLATFTASGSSNLRRVWQSRGLRSVHRNGRVVRRSTHPGDWPQRLVCPLVGSHRCRLSVESPDHVSAVCGPDTGTGIRPVIHDDQLEALALLSWFPAPGTAVLTLTGVADRPAPAASQPPVPAPRHNHHPCGDPLDEASTKGSRVFTRPIFPSPVTPGWNTGALGFPPSSAPRPYRRRTSGRGQVVEHGPEPTLYVIDLASKPALISPCVRPRVGRDKSGSVVRVPPFRAKRVDCHGRSDVCGKREGGLIVDWSMGSGPIGGQASRWFAGTVCVVEGQHGRVVVVA